MEQFKFLTTKQCTNCQSKIRSEKDSLTHLSFVYIDFFCFYDVIDDVIKGGMHVQNYPASHWSALFTVMNHIASVYLMTLIEGKKGLLAIVQLATVFN